VSASVIKAKSNLIKPASGFTSIISVKCPNTSKKMLIRLKTASGIAINGENCIFAADKENIFHQPKCFKSTY